MKLIILRNRIGGGDQKEQDTERDRNRENERVGEARRLVLG